MRNAAVKEKKNEQDRFGNIVCAVVKEKNSFKHLGVSCFLPTASVGAPVLTYLVRSNTEVKLGNENELDLWFGLS